MKKIILLLLLSFSTCIFAQRGSYYLNLTNASLIKKNGEKVTFKDGKVEINSMGQKVYYPVPDKKGMQHTSFDDIDFIKTDKFLLKSYDFGKGLNLYMVLADSPDKKMITKTGLFSYDFAYTIRIVDNSGNIIDELKSHGGPPMKGYVHRKFIEPFIKKHFSDCKQLIDRIPDSSQFTENSEGYILLDDPIYIQCN